MCLVLYSKCPGCCRSLAETDIQAIEFCRQQQINLRTLEQQLQQQLTGIKTENNDSKPAAAPPDGGSLPLLPYQYYTACDLQELWGVNEYEARFLHEHKCTPWQRDVDPNTHFTRRHAGAVSLLRATRDFILDNEAALGMRVSSAPSLLRLDRPAAEPPVQVVDPMCMSRDQMWLHMMVRQKRRQARNSALGRPSVRAIGGLMVWSHGETPTGVVDRGSKGFADGKSIGGVVGGELGQMFPLQLKVDQNGKGSIVTADEAIVRTPQSSPAKPKVEKQEDDESPDKKDVIKGDMGPPPPPARVQTALEQEDRK